MLTTAVLVVLTFFGVTLIGHAGHWAIHQKWARRFNKSHMTHHLKLYPPHDYTSEKYRDAGGDSTWKTFALFSLPLLAAPWVGVALGLLTVSQAIVLMVSSLLFGMAHDYVHDAFHVKGHWLNRFKIFKRWNLQHYQHHVNMKKNFGIFFYAWDKLFGTYQEP